MAEVVSAVLGDFSAAWTAEDAGRAVERAPSLTGRQRAHALGAEFEAEGASVGQKRLAVARWAVAELKIVHSGRPNQHLHDALDAMLADMPAD